MMKYSIESKPNFEHIAFGSLSSRKCKENNCIVYFTFLSKRLIRNWHSSLFLIYNQQTPNKSGIESDNVFRLNDKHQKNIVSFARYKLVSTEPSDGQKVIISSNSRENGSHI